MGALYFGVGKSVGSLVGGLVIDELGVRNTFRCFGAVALVAASLYFLFTFMWDKRRTKEDLETGPEETKEDNQGEILRKTTELGGYREGTYSNLINLTSIKVWISKIFKTQICIQLVVVLSNTIQGQKKSEIKR